MRAMRLATVFLTLGIALCATTPAYATPTLQDLTLNPETVQPGGMSTGTVTLSGPADPGGDQVTLSAAPADGATVPSSVTVPAGQTQAEFQISGGYTGTSATITATLGADTVARTLTVDSQLVYPVINEVDYDQVGADTASFIEILNDTCSPVDLTNLAVVLVDGATNTEYDRIALADAATTLKGGGSLLIANSAVAVPAGVPTISKGTADWIQNGAPDGIALVDTLHQTLLDALSYGGSITFGQITGFPGTYNLVEGSPTSAVDSNTVVGSLTRSPDGKDTNSAASDWAFTSTPTPGEPNGSGCNHAPSFAAIGDRSVMAGQTLSFTVTATDADGDALTFGASTLPAGATFDSATHTFSWTPTALQVGTYSGVHFTVSDGKDTSSQDITLTVTAPSAVAGAAGSGEQTPPSGSSVNQPPSDGGGTSTPPSSPAHALNTTITKLRVTGRTATVNFTGSGGLGARRFQCKLDKGRFKPCRSPARFKGLKRGKHTVQVRASTSGAVDKTPATKTFVVKR
jgi:hypothetical protein